MLNSPDSQNQIAIGHRIIGGGAPCFIIGEAGVNHDGSVESAFKLVDMAVQAGLDAVKFQTFVAARVVIPHAPKARYQIETTGNEESQLDMLRRLELSPSAHRDIQAYCHERGILFLSTPFDEESADLLEELRVPAFKIPSGEITNWPFLEHVARKGKPLILSTGMSSLPEVEQAVAVIQGAGNRKLALLHCVSAYPAEAGEVNLRAMQTMARTFGVPIGYSDHTLGLEVSLAAVALGACILEKHFTLDCSLPGPDHRASLEPGELQALVRSVRRIEAALGTGRKEPAPCEAETALVSRKSMVAACDIPAGTSVTRNLIAMKNPGTGWPPSMLEHVVGRVAVKNISANTLLTEELFR